MNEAICNQDFNHFDNLSESEQRIYIRYLFGECEYFAYALHKEFGYDMFRVFGEDEDGNEMSVHVFCIDGSGNFIDIRGLTNSVRDFFYPYEDFLDASAPSIFKYTPVQYIIDDYEGLHGAVSSERSTKIALDYIKQNYQRYSGDSRQVEKECFECC